MERSEKAIYLEKCVQYHDRLYWEKNAPTITDPEYDDLVRQLLLEEPDNEYIKLPKTPEVNSTGKVIHKTPMLSLDKAYSYQEVVKWCEKVARSDREEFKVMFKFDGVSGQLEDGILATRGDGLIGEDITHKLPFMEIIAYDPTKVRGEILFTKETFQKIKGLITRKSGENYKNERNAVGGVLSRDDLAPVQILTFIEFDYRCLNYSLIFIKGLGESGWTDVIEFTKESPFPTDGIVIQISDKEYAESLGATSHHLKSAIAFKFSNPFQWTVLREVEFSPGKHDITPVGKVDPVEISGVTVSSPSLHNWKNILDRDLHIGDEVKVERAGDVIPYISESRPGKERTPIIIPPCPVCGAEVVYIDPQIECSNPECHGKTLNRLTDSVVRIGIERLGKPTIEKMMQKWMVEDLVDIFSLAKEDILAMDRMGETSSQNLFNEIDKVRQGGVYEWQILAALNIPGIGRTLSKKLLDGRTLDELAELSPSKLETMPDIGPERAAGLIRGMQNNYGYMHTLLKILPIKQMEVKKEGLIKVCFTGSFPEKKQYYYDLLQQNGGYEVLEKVSGIDILIVADPTKNSAKQQAAEKKGIRIMGINELLNTLKGN